VPWVINNTIQVVVLFVFKIIVLIVILVEIDHFDLNMTVRAKNVWSTKGTRSAKS
jgi:hypothetical protein